MPTEVRAARPQDGDAVARLLYLSAAGKYDRFAGSRDAALRLLRRAFARPGTSASAEIVWVAEVDGEVAGALSGFPIGEGPRRGRAFFRLTFTTLSPLRWPGVVRVWFRGTRLTPPAPAPAFYVDGLAIAPHARRRGAATALLAAAERRARALGLPALALDTNLDNLPARSLYERFGFEVVEEVPPRPGLPGFVGYVKRLS